MLRQKDAVQLWHRLLPLARKAGSAILDVCERGLTQVDVKAHDSPVTLAELAEN